MKGLLVVLCAVAAVCLISMAVASGADDKPAPPTSRPARPQPAFPKETQMMRALDNPALNLTDDQKAQIKAKLDAVLKDVVETVLTADQKATLEKAAAPRPPRRNPETPAPAPEPK